jgi:hypothetical protein
VIDITLSSSDLKRDIYIIGERRQRYLFLITVLFVSKSYRIPESLMNTGTLVLGALFERTGLFDARLEKDIVNTCTIDECAAMIQSSIIKAYEKS